MYSPSLASAAEAPAPQQKASATPVARPCSCSVPSAAPDQQALLFLLVLSGVDRVQRWIWFHCCAEREICGFFRAASLFWRSLFVARSYILSLNAGFSLVSSFC